MVRILDWIFEGIANWIASIITELMDAVSGIFLNALNTDMVVMEEYFPFVTVAFDILQYIAWAILFLIVVWQLFRVFGGPITEAENPLHLLVRGTLFAFLIGGAKPIFQIILDIARAPYTALMDASLDPGDFTFAGIEQVLQNGITTLVSVVSIVGLILLLVLMISLGWNYFKLLLEVVERYVIVGVLCYTSPLAYSMGVSKATTQVFRSWCRMVGSQLILLIMNVWFLRAFNSSVGQFVANGGALTNGDGSIFLWVFCALAFLKTAQKFDSYLSALGLSVAQTGSSMGMEMLMAARVLGGFSGGTSKNAGNVFGSNGKTSAAGSASSTGSGFASGFTSAFKGNSYVRDAVVEGGSRMGASGPAGFVARAFGGMAAKGGATLTGESISSVASGIPNISGKIGGDIADTSLKNYMPQLEGMKLSGTEVSGGRISTTATTPDGKEASIEMFHSAQFDKPEAPHTVATASDGSEWYQMAAGDGMGYFNETPQFSGDISEMDAVSQAFPGLADGTSLRTIDDGVLEASYADGSNSMMYSSAHYDEPDAPHETVVGADGMSWYSMQSNAEVPEFEDTGSFAGTAGGMTGVGIGADGYSMPSIGTGADGQSMPGTDGAHMSPQEQEAYGAALQFNQTQFQSFMPGYENQVSAVDSSGRSDGKLEVKHSDGSGTAFYDKTMYQSPRGDHKVYEDKKGGQWYAIPGTPSVEQRPMYQNGSPVYNEKNQLQTYKVDTIKYKTTPQRFEQPKKIEPTGITPPKRKQ